MFFLIRFYVVLDIGASPLAAWELPKIHDHVVMASLFTFYEWTWVLYYDIPGHVYLYYQFFKEIFKKSLALYWFRPEASLTVSDAD